MKISFFKETKYGGGSFRSEVHKRAERIIIRKHFWGSNDDKITHRIQFQSICLGRRQSNSFRSQDHLKKTENGKKKTLNYDKYL